MRKIVVSLLGLFLFCCFSIADAQQKKFNENPGGFVQEMSDWLIEELGKEKQLRLKTENLMERFDTAWNTIFSLEQQMMVIATTNFMYERKMRPSPHFLNYFETLLLFMKSDQTYQSLVDWDHSLQYIAGNRYRSFMEYLELTSNLINEGVIYKSGITTWKSRSKNFWFAFEEKPLVVFGETSLVCYSNNDSSIIYNTEGVYQPIDNKWEGTKGKVTWERVNFDPDEAYAQFNRYRVNMKFSKFNIDSVLFFYKALFDEPLVGSLHENVQYFKDTSSVSYPRFRSYEQRYNISDVYEDVDYSGGFSLYGSKFIGSGDIDNPAMLYFKYKGKQFVKVSSRSFTIRPEKVSSGWSSVVIYIDNDSVYHPGLRLEYRAKDKWLEMVRVEEGTGQSPFTNTYHNLDMNCDMVVWDLTKGKISFGGDRNISGYSSIAFSSDTYFSKPVYDMLAEISPEHPLRMLRRISKQYGRDTITLGEMVNFMRRDEADVVVFLCNLANMGFIYYDIDKRQFAVKERVARYITAAYGLLDYDVIRFVSAPDKIGRAELDLNNYHLDIYGVQQFELSDSQQVAVRPKGDHLTVLENRDLLFSGDVYAGLFYFYVNDAVFNFNDFEINMPAIDSIKFKVQSFDPNDLNVYGKRNMRNVRASLENVSGVLEIDHPGNKSGIKHYPEYPVFTCKTHAKTYYYGKRIHNGTYVREKFYYEIEPFIIDSLNTFSTTGLEFTGRFVSAGIFPDLFEPLKVMPDYSLGFNYNTPSSGLPAYGGRGKFFNKLELSKKGLYGSGSLNYLTSRAVSENFLFCPDSTIADVSAFNVVAKSTATEYPSLEATDVKLKWYPYEDVMKVINKEKYKKLKTNPFDMFNGRAALHGNFELSSTGSHASGTMVIRDAEIDATLFEFSHHTIDAKSVDFRLKATYSDYELGGERREGYEIMTYDYMAHIDFSKEYGVFTSNSGESMVDFTINQYMASIDKFEWFMNSESIKLENTQRTGMDALKDLSIEELLTAEMVGAKFISTNPFQDSLSFYASEALYDRKRNIIEAEGVHILRLADAAVIPDKGKLRIFKKAEMDTLYNAQMVTNIHTMYHNFYDVTLAVKGKNEFEGHGNYDYVDMTESQQKINFYRIYANKEKHTIALGKVLEEDNFTLSPYFDFYGDVTLKSANRFLYFDGGTRIKHICDTFDREWLKFAADIDPEDVMIPVSSKPENLFYNDLTIGILVSKDTTDVYPGFIVQKGRINDKEIIYADGFLIYDEPLGEYRVSNLKKLDDKLLPGNYVSLNTKSCIIEGVGKFALGENMGLVNLEAIGSVEHFIEDDSTLFSMVMSLDFHFSEKALKVMYKDIAAGGSGGVSLNSDAYLLALDHWLGSNRADEAITEVNLFGYMKSIPEQMQKTFVFADISLYYSSITNSFVSDKQIGIGNIGGTPLNLYVDGILELSREKSGDQLTLFFETGEYWYLFEYSRGRMMAISSNEDFNRAIRETKPDDRKLFNEQTRELYMYTLSTPRKKKSFLRKFEFIWGEDTDD